VEIAGKVILTPLEDPWGYTPDWRNQVALLADGRKTELYPYVPDEYIGMQIDYLKTSQDDTRLGFLGEMSLSPDGRSNIRYAIKVANDIFRSVGLDSLAHSFVKDKVEAMLLCQEISLAEIASEFNVDPMVVKAYERLFYNIRDDRGDLLAALWIREYFAKGRNADVTDRGNHGMYWKVLAFEGGKEELWTVWKWRKDKTVISEVGVYTALWRQSFKVLEEKLRFGNMDSKSLAQLFGDLRQGLKEMRERGAISGDEKISIDSLVHKVLSLAVPTMVIPSVEKLAEQAAALEEKKALTKKLDRTKPGVTGTLDAIDAQATVLKS
jgi:hypothetical protein